MHLTWIRLIFLSLNLFSVVRCTATTQNEYSSYAHGCQIGGPVSLSICVHSPSELCTTRNEVHEISFPRKFDVAPNVAVSLAGFDSYAGMESEIP
ncbi:unnamed protein product [Rotaria sp. Silwood1]|nr:unnamed protein product [Rotaria sp. Silwood1]CAF1654138.1 unnamed protein product [Rotaria sp. Silwood1]CAF5033744.1 unnamed protein product [Rotaria sp. Silwood1]